MTHITSEPFGITKSGDAVTRWTMENDAGMCVRILDYGCTVQSILVPGRNGTRIDVALGYDDIAGYEAGSCYFGAVVGRYANRIKGAAFTLGDKTCLLPKNDGNNHLHGVFCHAMFCGGADGELLALERISPDGEEGFPGTLRVEVRYQLTGDDALVITYDALSDADTVLNLTNHTYFNLNGQGDILDHVLALDADRFTEIDGETLPTGSILPVEHTPMDFRAPRTIGAQIDADDPQLRLAHGYDHNYILNGADSTLRKFAEVYSPESGVRLTGYTTQPAVQLYTGNYIDTDAAPCGKGGVRYPRRGGFCLETQHFPCSPNFPHFPTTLLRAGEVYHQETIYRFSSEGSV